MKPSRAQGIFLAKFEELYFVDKRTQETLEKEMTVARGKNPDMAVSRGIFSRSTYHSWRRQDTSPSIHDLELLCMLADERQTLIVDPSSSKSDGGDDMEWLEHADSLIARIGNLSAHQRGVVLGKMEGLVAQSEAGSPNPQVSDVAPGPRGVRHGK